MTAVGLMTAEPYDAKQMTIHGFMAKNVAQTLITDEILGFPGLEEPLE